MIKKRCVTSHLGVFGLDVATSAHVHSTNASRDSAMVECGTAETTLFSFCIKGNLGTYYYLGWSIHISTTTTLYPLCVD